MLSLKFLAYSTFIVLIIIAFTEPSQFTLQDITASILVLAIIVAAGFDSISKK